MSQEITSRKHENASSAPGQQREFQRAVVAGLPICERYGVTVQTAAQYIGISKSRIYELLAAGELNGKIIHGRRIVLVESLMGMLGKAPTARHQNAA
jgi:excisionase family DNA binding protein